MVDPFAAINHECGEITASQEDLLRNGPFINDSHISADAIFLSTSSSDGSAFPPPAADAPILICSVPDSPFSPAAPITSQIGGGDDLHLRRGLRLASPVETAMGESSAEEQRSPPRVQPSVGSPPQALTGGDPNGGAQENLGFANQGKKARVSKRRSKGPQIRSTCSPPETSAGAAEDAGSGGAREPSNSYHDQEGTRSMDEFENYRYQSVDVLKDVISNPNAASGAVLGSRRLPATIQNVLEERITGTSSIADVGIPPTSMPTAEVASSHEDPEFPANLLDVVNAFSRKPNQRFEDTDILEIAAMKGLDSYPPQWWRPEGYDTKGKATE